jgi:hypothetical protein
MPVEFISATHTTPTTEATAGGRRSGFDVARPFEIICEIEPPIRPDLPAGIRQGNTATGHGAASVSRVDCLLAWQRIEVLS